MGKAVLLLAVCISAVFAARPASGGQVVAGLAGIVAQNTDTCQIAHSTFNALAETCVHTPCNIMEGLLQVDAEHPAGYIMCLAGSMVIDLLCPPGTEFSAQVKICV